MKKEKEYKIALSEFLIKEKEQKINEEKYIEAIKNYQKNIDIINSENQNNILNDINIFLAKINSRKDIYKKKISELNDDILNNVLNKNYNEKDFINLEPISKGGYGIIYSAYSIKDKTEICLKKINIDEMKINYEKNEISDDSYLRDLNNEIEILKLLSWNKNSVKFYGYYEKDNERVLIIEKCDEDMEKFMKNNGKSLTTKKIKNIFNELNEIFYILQMKKIMHRDLKLTHLLIKYKNKEKNEYTVKLADFGISKFINESNKNFSGYKGTFDSAAPEIILQKIEKYDTINDIFSLGIILYQLSHNLKHPFKEYEFENIYEKYKNNYDEDSYNIKFDKSIENKDFKNLVERMLKLNPKNRINWNEYFEHAFFK